MGGRRVRRDMKAVEIEDLRRKARARLPRFAYAYVENGSYRQITLRRNREDLDRLALTQRVMQDVAERNLASSLLGEPAALPLALAPCGLTGITHPNAEQCAARAAARFPIPFALSTLSVARLEDVAAASAQPIWFQLYLLKDRGVSRSLIERARAAGCGALILTLDLHVRSKRHPEARHGMNIPPRPSLRSLADLLAHPRWTLSMLASRRKSFGNLEPYCGPNVFRQAKWLKAQFDPTIDEQTIAWVREQWPGKLVLKSILRADDAVRAFQLGADAIVVSNHGGRQLDSAPSTICVLPAIRDAVGTQREVLFDGGVRTGFDLLKALGCGANACLIGRAYLYGLAAGGEAGAARAIELIRDELSDAMALTGVRDLHRLPPDLVRPQPA